MSVGNSTQLRDSGLQLGCTVKSKLRALRLRPQPTGITLIRWSPSSKLDSCRGLVPEAMSNRMNCAVKFYVHGLFKVEVLMVPDI